MRDGINSPRNIFYNFPSIVSVLVAVSKTLNLKECAEILKADQEVVARLARNGDLPGAKIGRAWVFVEEQVLNFLRERIEKQSGERRHGKEPIATYHGRTAKRRKPLPRLPELPPEFKK